jgi:flavin-dependent dehydrogenase
MLPEPAANTDVVIIGGGLAGTAAAIQLTKAGLSVIIIEPEQRTRPTVGESLDWSAPDLLKALGLPMEKLVASGMATWKRHVTLRLRDGCSEQYEPSSWLANAPMKVELRTLHLDRGPLDRQLSRLAVDQGARLVRDKVISVERQDDRVLSVQTSAGSKFSGSWFIDASGSGTSLLARSFNIAAVQYGPAKVALWNYFPATRGIEGTTLYMDPSPTEYLEWVWEIPINPTTVSVGFTTTGAAMKIRREQGLTIEDIFRQQLQKFPRFEAMLREGAMDEISVTSFRCRAHVRSAGSNWLMAGEAASMVDPITANGVTAALRHSSEASTLILKFQKQGRLPARATSLYSSRILELSKFFNSGIESIVYEPAIRKRLGARLAGTVYTSPAWTMNLVYARLRPTGWISTMLFNSLIGLFRLASWAALRICKLSDEMSATLSRSPAPLP